MTATATPAPSPPRAGFADLRVRIVSAVVLVVAALGALVLGGAPFIIFWLVASLAVHWEWQRIVGPERRLARTLAGDAALCVAAALCVQFAADLATIVILLGALAAAALGSPARRVWAAAGVLYAGVLIIAVITIRPALALPLERPFDVRAIVWLFAVVWGTDVMAYFGGRFFGGPKVWPAVSPGKTWSGTLVGIVCGAFAGVLVGQWRSLIPMPMPTSISMSVPMSVLPLFAVGLGAAAAAQAGDFLESGIKRRFSVKDSSALIPGHGGVMDRLDGFIAAAAFVVFVAFLRDASSVGEAIFRW